MATYRFNGLRYAQSEELFGHLGESTELSGTGPMPSARHARRSKLSDNFTTRREKVRLWSSDRRLLKSFMAAQPAHLEAQIDLPIDENPAIGAEAIGGLAFVVAEVELDQAFSPEPRATELRHD